MDAQELSQLSTDMLGAPNADGLFLALDALDLMAEAVSIIGPDGVNLYTNAAAAEVLADIEARHDGLPLTEVASGSLDTHGNPLPGERLPVEITRNTGEPCSGAEVGFPDARGDVRWLLINSRRLSKRGPPFAVVASYTDVTATRRTIADLERQRGHYRTVVAALHEGVIIQAADGDVKAVNVRAQQLLGLSEEQLRGLTPIDPRWRSVHPDGSPAPSADHASVRVLATGQAQLDELMGIHTPDGELRWLRVNATPLRDPDGAVSGVVATFGDETERISARAELQRANAQFSAAFAEAPIGMALVGLDGRFMRVNRALSALTGWNETELLARTFQDITHSDDLDADLALLATLVSGDRDSYTMQKRYITAAGDLIWVNLNASVVRSAAGEPEHFIAQIEDITERKKFQDALQHMADNDPLTDLWNRRRFEQELGREIARCRRYDKQAALFLLDLDGFKQVNDTLGHKAGDDLLRAVASTMRGRLRITDSMARIGGDEFVVLLPSINAEQAAALARELAEAIGLTRIRVAGDDVAAMVSIGVTILDRDVSTPESALASADRAMYEAKAVSPSRRRELLKPSDVSSDDG